MNFYSTLAIILTLSIALTYVNHRFIHMQATIGIMFASLLLSLALLVSSAFGFASPKNQVAHFLTGIDFHALLINGMLSFLLFAGALTVDIQALRQRKWEIIILALGGTLSSTLILGVLIYYTLPLVGLHLTLMDCFMFGALISPTDPIAVLAMCKEVKAPRRLSACIAGESLFNDGVGIVIFLTLYTLTFTENPFSWETVAQLFVHQTIGGIVYGFLLGWFAAYLQKPIDDHKIEILLTIAVTTGGYTLAQYLGFSGPLAMVVCGLFLGNKGRSIKTSSARRYHKNLENFWEIIDELLNAILFLLIGFELLVIPLHAKPFLMGLLCIPVVLLVRFITVGTPLRLFKIWRTYSPHVIKIMTWGGLRGGLAVALALALPPGGARELILAMTYTVVLFSILIQGTTIKTLVKRSKS